MTIQKKALTILFIIFVLSLISTYFITNEIILKSFQRLEIADIETNTKRLENIVASDLQKLSALVLDYASWDDSYLYVEGKMNDYPQKNLSLSVFQSYKLNLIVFLNNEGKVILNQKFENDKNAIENIDVSTLSSLIQSTHLIKHREAKSEVKGIITLANTPYLVASRPITKTEIDGTFIGTIIFAKEITDNLIHEFEERLKLRISFIYKYDKALFKVINDHVEYKSNNSTKALSPNHENIYLLNKNTTKSVLSLPDIKSSDNFIFEIYFNRNLYHEGNKTIAILVSTICAIFIILFLAITFFVIKNIYHDLKPIIAGIIIIRKERNLNYQFPIPKMHEFSLVAKELNSMLHGLFLAEQENKKLHSQLIHTSKLASLGTLAAGVAHEINNPLMISNGLLENLANEIESQGTLSDSTRKIIHKIENANYRIKNIAEGLRIYSRHDGEKVEIIDCKNLIQEIISFIDDMVKKKDISIHFHADITHSKILGNKGKLHQVLLNLINNAVDAINMNDQWKGPKPDQFQAMIEINIYNKESNIIITLSDNGPGIAEEHLNKIFDPFFTTKAEGKGTGIGLSISQGIVKEFRGEMSVKSKIGHGTTFTLSFPCTYTTITNATTTTSTSESVTTPVTATEVESPIDSHMILVVDDEKDIREIIENFLKETPYKVITASDGLEALDLLEKDTHQKIRIVITDIRMPNMSGDRLVLAIKEKELPQRTIIITGALNEERTIEQREVIKNNADDFLQKPFSKKDLLKKLSEL